MFEAFYTCILAGYFVQAGLITVGVYGVHVP